MKFLIILWISCIRGICAFGLWIFFVFGLCCALFISLTLFIPGMWKFVYIRNFFKAASRMDAAMFAKSGRNMLSTEVCFDPRFYWMKKMLDTAEQGEHCLKSVYAEGAYCSLRDHQIRSK